MVLTNEVCVKCRWCKLDLDAEYKLGHVIGICMKTRNTGEFENACYYGQHLSCWGELFEAGVYVEETREECDGEVEVREASRGEGSEDELSY